MLNQMEINLMLIELSTNLYEAVGELTKENIQFELDQNWNENVNIIEVNTENPNEVNIEFIANEKLRHLNFFIK